MTITELTAILKARCSCPNCELARVAARAETVEAEPDQGRPVFFVPEVRR